jgi:uncharacterized metal-binding protein
MTKQTGKEVGKKEEGMITLLVLMLLTMGTFFLVPSLGLSSTALRRIHLRC